MPAPPSALALFKRAGRPAEPSANLLGQVSPTTAQHVADQLQLGIDYILDGGPSPSASSRPWSTCPARSQFCCDPED